MAGVGHITVFGLADYGKAFKNTAPAINKLITDSMRVSNQYLVGLSAAVSTFNYYRMGRLVLPLGLALAVGSILGSYLVPVITAGKISIKDYLGYFGLVVFIIGGFLFYETTPKGQAGKKEAKAAAKAFEDMHIKKCSNLAPEDCGVQVSRWSLSKVVFKFYGVEFNFRPIIPVIGGFFIASLAAFLGNRRRLSLRTLSDQYRRSAHVPGRRHIRTYGFCGHDHQYFYLHGSKRSPGLLALDRGGTDRHFRRFHDRSTNLQVYSRYLAQTTVVVLALYVGLRYTTKGFLGYSIVPPF